MSRIKFVCVYVSGWLLQDGPLSNTIPRKRSWSINAQQRKSESEECLDRFYEKGSPSFRWGGRGWMKVGGERGRRGEGGGGGGGQEAPPVQALVCNIRNFFFNVAQPFLYKSWKWSFKVRTSSIQWAGGSVSHTSRFISLYYYDHTYEPISSHECNDGRKTFSLGEWMVY